MASKRFSCTATSSIDRTNTEAWAASTIAARSNATSVVGGDTAVAHSRSHHGPPVSLVPGESAIGRAPALTLGLRSAALLRCSPGLHAPFGRAPALGTEVAYRAPCAPRSYSG